MDDFGFGFREAGGRTVIADLQRILSASAESTIQELLSLVRKRKARACVLDGSGLRGLDGAGLFAIAKFCARASKEVQSLSAFGFSPSFRRILEGLGFRSCVALFASEAAALSAVGGYSPRKPPHVLEDADHSSAVGWLDPRSQGPRLVGPFEGFGSLWHKVYRVRLAGNLAAPTEVARLLKARLPAFWPPGNRLTFPPEGGVPGAVARIVLRLAGGVPLRTGAQVIHADDLSFTLATLAGHVEAGWIHFGAGSEGDFTVIQVQSLGRGSDPLYEVGLRLFGHSDQERFWRDTLKRMASHLGSPARAETEKWCIDTGLRWKAAVNLRHNAALRAPLELLADAVAAGRRFFAPGSPASSDGGTASAEPAGRPARRTILVLGGGYGGLACLRALSGRLSPLRYRIQLIDATPYHTIKTRFHERAVLASREPLIRLPLSTLVAASGAEFVQDEVLGIDFLGRTVKGRARPYRYDRLVVALGGQIAYFGVEGAAEHTVSLQTYEQAVECCRRVAALRNRGARGPARRVVVVGAGIEGLEVATMLRQEIAARECEIVVLERSTKLMVQSQCRDAQKEYVRAYLERRGISLRLGAAIHAVEPEHVVLESGERLASDLTVWCSGIRPVSVVGVGDGEPFRVGPFLQCEDHPEVFAVGDFATVDSSEEAANLRSAQRAAYHGALAGENLLLLEKGRPMKPVRYRPIGELTALGDLDGVGLVFGVPLTGLLAALLKKAHEAKYLAETYRDLPGAMARRLLALGHRNRAR
jgi:NADH:ubiquinone reductase (H+-translocating)